MFETFIALLCAHLVADFVLQTDGLIRNKRNPLLMLVHAFIVLVTAVFFLGGVPITMLVILVGTHIAMDAAKVYLLPPKLWSFLLDQGVHIAVIFALAGFWPGEVSQGLWSTLPGDGLSWYLAGLVLASGVIASLRMGAILIRNATTGMTGEMPAQIEGLTNGGFIIGCLERALVMLLILIGQPSGVGFLIAAKSILRFGDVTNPSERKMTEYIIIGTFMSFGWGLLVAVLTAMGIETFRPGLLPLSKP